MSGVSKITIKDINYKHFNLICLSNIYIGNKYKLHWKCLICNYEFYHSKNHIDRYYIRCKGCFDLQQLNKVKLFAKERGGKCLTTKYKSSTDEIKFKCKSNHIFNMKYSNAINLGHWCSICSKTNNISEEICRSYFEAMFGKKFKKIRPNWLINNSNAKLELDGYCEKFNLAFEHNGTFHFSNKLKDHLQTQSNDLIKSKLCKLYNINLIIIDQLFNKTPLNNLRSLILEKCYLLNILVPFPNAKVNLKKCYNDRTKESAKFYSKLAKSKGGECLSEYCGEVNIKLIWKCKLGHKWKQYPYVIKRGHWCPVCAGQLKSKNIVNK